VDDGSKDRTAEVVYEKMKRNERIKLLKLGINRGKGGAVKRGVQAATGRYILMVRTSSLHHR
jgi:glycosyltransferase involved in cell wall biosynthesis